MAGLEAQEHIVGSSGGIQEYFIGVPARVQMSAWGPDNSTMVEGGLGWCDKPGQMAVLHGGAAMAETVLGQAVVPAVASKVSMVASRSLEPWTPLLRLEM